LDAAGVERRRHPSWGRGDAEEFWREVNGRLRAGILPTGRRRVLGAAFERYPANPVFVAGMRSAPPLLGSAEPTATGASALSRLAAEDPAPGSGWEPGADAEPSRRGRGSRLSALTEPRLAALLVSAGITAVVVVWAAADHDAQPRSDRPGPGPAATPTASPEGTPTPPGGGRYAPLYRGEVVRVPLVGDDTCGHGPWVDIDINPPAADTTFHNGDDVGLDVACGSDPGRGIHRIVLYLDEPTAAAVSLDGRDDPRACQDAVRTAHVGTGAEIRAGKKLCVQSRDGVLAFAAVSDIDVFDTVTLTVTAWRTD
jgi:hypothetical protein